MDLHINSSKNHEQQCTTFVAQKLNFITSILLLHFVAFSSAEASARNQIQMAPARLNNYLLHSVQPEKSSTTCRSKFVQNLVNCIIRIENSTALLFAKSRNLIGTVGIAEFRPK